MVHDVLALQGMQSICGSTSSSESCNQEEAMTCYRITHVGLETQASVQAFTFQENAKTLHFLLLKRRVQAFISICSSAIRFALSRTATMFRRKLVMGWTDKTLPI
jgi:hypothetical protein